MDAIMVHNEVKGSGAQVPNVLADVCHLSGTGDSQRDSRESIRANRSQLKPLFSWRVRPIRPHSNFRFAQITRFARIMRIDSRESRH